MSNIYEVKIKHNDQICKSWENITGISIPVINLGSTEDEIKALENLLNALINNNSNIYEIRWNRSGLLQGHYIAGSKGKLQ